MTDAFSGGHLLTWAGIALCTAQAGIFSGLNLAVFSVSRLRLEVEAAGGNDDAAKVLGYMSDEEVQGVLQQLGVRPAAGLLAALPKERAAVLSRRLLTGGDRTVVAP